MNISPDNTFLLGMGIVTVFVVFMSTLAWLDDHNKKLIRKRSLKGVSVA
jgi:hypothetical protein